jgi:cation diffusion facilitator family transporter
MPDSSSKRVIYATLVADVAITLTKFVAAWFTGSAAMLSEAVHTLVDTGAELLLLYGLHRGARPPDEFHPFGHGRELYFWSFIVSLLVFALGAGVAAYGGMARVVHPQPINHPMISYIVLGLSFFFEGIAWLIALRAFRHTKGQLGYLEAMRESKDPTSFMVLLVDSAALVGLVIALIGTYVSDALGVPAFDGAASIGVGLVLCVTAMFLSGETKDLLIGERVHPELARSIRSIVSDQPGVEHVRELLTVHLGPRQVLAMLNVGFVETLTTGEIETTVEIMEQRLKSAHPQIEAVFVKPQSFGADRRAREQAMARR